MKTKLTFLSYYLFVAIFLMIGCNKSTNNNLAIENKAVINEVLNMKNVNEQNTSYSLLNTSQKILIWNKHLNDCLKSEKFNLKQKQLINDFIKLVTEDTFEDYNFFNRREVAILTSRITNEFSQKLKTLAFSSLASPLTNNLREGEPIGKIGVGGTNCKECGTTDDWCLPFSKCVRGGCTQTEDGCGWFKTKPCDGLCFPS